MLALEGKTLTSRSMEWKECHQALWLRTWGRMKVKHIPALTHLARPTLQKRPYAAGPHICVIASDYTHRHTKPYLVAPLTRVCRGREASQGGQGGTASCLFF